MIKYGMLRVQKNIFNDEILFVRNMYRIFYSNIYIEQGATLHSLFYLETALHVSGGTITYH